MQVPAGCRNLKVQAWGAGGGSGHFSGGQCGGGGGGSFAEAILYVTPEEELEVTALRTLLPAPYDPCREATALSPFTPYPPTPYGPSFSQTPRIFPLCCSTAGAFCKKKKNSIPRHPVCTPARRSSDGTSRPPSTFCSCRIMSVKKQNGRPHLSV